MLLRPIVLVRGSVARTCYQHALNEIVHIAEDDPISLDRRNTSCVSSQFFDLQALQNRVLDCFAIDDSPRLLVNKLVSGRMKEVANLKAP